jgi:NAD(P)-dependent dehydrogenase (short-subunit alcohol dehydrogenase family)
MSQIIDQKVAVVTGSSKGIGKAIAIRLAKDGYFVYVTYHTDKLGGEDTIMEIKKIGGNASLHMLDVSSEESVTQLFKTIENEFGHLDVLVNNALKEVSKSIEIASFDEWKYAIDTKVNGSWLVTKYALPLLKKGNNANIVVITTTADERPGEDILSYAVASGALNTFIKAIAIHFAKYNIRVNAISPGQTRTDNWGADINNDELWKEFAETNPMKRVATVEDIADAVMIPINDPHRFFNGNFFYVNGGGHLK